MILPKRNALWIVVATLALLAPPAAKSQEQATQSQQTPEKKKKPAPKKAPPAQAEGEHEHHAAPGQPKAEPGKPAPPTQKMENMKVMPAEHQQHAQPLQEPQKPPEIKPAPQMPGMEHMQHMGRIPTVKPEFPRLGKSQENPPTPLVSLDEMEQMALASNPTLRQAQAEIGTSKARQLQSGLYPNPSVGYTGEEIRGGSFGGGQQGFFVSQTIVTAGKLGLNRKIFRQEVRISEIEAEEQRLRVLNAVQLAYYRVLTAQEMLDTERDLLRISEDTLKVAGQLRNIGQADDTEVLQAEVEVEQHKIAVESQEHTLRQEWKSLAAFVGKPGLEMRTVAGFLDRGLPEVEDEQIVQKLLTDSPAVRMARSSVDRWQAIVARERREPIPDIEVRAGLQRNGELLEPSRRRVGLQGFAEVGIQIPIFNRNQGTVEAARLQVERARREEQRVELVLRERTSAVLDTYHRSRIMAERYRTQLLPRAQKAYELMVQKYGLMLASYPQVLLAQRTLFQLHTEYIAALEGLWMSGITLRGLLLTDGLEAPARPGEVDMPVREINVPMMQRMKSREQ
ncbi:MAG: TolC family protein [Acidobacteria bacterium]|nr:TolC family protein [Acidobacteriota bacterium]